MLQRLKKLVPQSVREFLHPIKHVLINQPRKKRFAAAMAQKHELLLKEVAKKDKIRVVFLVIHKSVWKADQVYQYMLADPYFEPIILTCPYTEYGEANMWQDLREVEEYFSQKGYNYQSSYDAKSKQWLTLESLKPDLVYFANPHDLTRPEYYREAYLNYLTCYAGYGFPVNSFMSGEVQYNKEFHNAIWKIFVQTVAVQTDYIKYGTRNLHNTHIVIDNIIEALNSKSSSFTPVNKVKKTIIWAPHHTISPKEMLRIGTFLTFAEHFKSLVAQYESEIDFVFKPHPLLKPKLYALEGWGTERTDAYYEFWQSQSNTRYENGAYIDLFLASDAMILDSGAFLAEYFFTAKPMLYLVKKETYSQFNQYGQKLLAAIPQAKTTADVDQFIAELLQNKSVVGTERTAIIQQYFADLGAEPTSKKLLQIIKDEIRSHAS